MSFRCQSYNCSQFEGGKCCEDSNETLVLVRDQGLQTLLDSCEIRDCVGLRQYLQTGPVNVAVHHSCRRRFTDA